MASELGKSFVDSLRASKQFRADSTKQAQAGFDAAWAGVPGSTPLDQFQSDKNTRYARDVVGWDKAQNLRKQAEAADTEAATPPPGRWDRRYNYVTNEMEWIPKESSNFWRANKDELIQVGGALAGGIVGSIVPGIGTVYGASLGRSLAKTGRDIYKTRQARRDVRDAKRDWDYQQALLADEEAKYGPKSGNLFKNAGEGVVEWATKDVERNKRKGTYERGAV